MTDQPGGPEPQKPREPMTLGRIILRVTLFMAGGFFVFVLLVLGTCFLRF